MGIHINAKNIVHHGVECVAFLAIGTVVCSSFSVACATYGVGKIIYIGTKKLLDTIPPTLSKQTKRSISWITSLLVSGPTLHIMRQGEGAGQSVSAWSTAIALAGTTFASLGVRALADKGFKYLY